MDRKEFKAFCHEEFTRRGFRKKKSMYYLKSREHGLLCGLELQPGHDYFYINCNFYMGEFDERQPYPTKYAFDLYGRPVRVWSQDTVNGQPFMDAMIEYAYHTPETLTPYFEEAFEKWILPPLREGKQELWKNLDTVWIPPIHDKKQVEDVMRKLQA